jgi:hypothetical protein
MGRRPVTISPQALSTWVLRWSGEGMAGDRGAWSGDMWTALITVCHWSLLGRPGTLWVIPTPYCDDGDRLRRDLVTDRRRKEGWRLT